MSKKKLLLSDEVHEALTELDEGEVKVILLSERESSFKEKTWKYILKKFPEGYNEEDRV